MVVNLILQRTGFERNYCLLERHMIGSFCSLNCCIVLSKPQNLDVFKNFFFINTEFHFNVFIKMENKTLCLSISFCVKIVLRTKSLTLGGLNSKYRAQLNKLINHYLRHSWPNYSPIIVQQIHYVFISKPLLCYS